MFWFVMLLQAALDPREELRLQLDNPPVEIFLDRPAGHVWVVEHPEWRNQPEIPFPDSAIHSVRDGRVDLVCLISREGRARVCRILTEAPAGYGLGQAALEGAGHFEFTPMSIDGIALEGLVEIPVTFTNTLEPDPESSRESGVVESPRSSSEAPRAER